MNLYKKVVIKGGKRNIDSIVRILNIIVKDLIFKSIKELKIQIRRSIMNKHYENIKEQL